MTLARQRKSSSQAAPRLNRVNCAELGRSCQHSLVSARVAVPSLQERSLPRPTSSEPDKTRRAKRGVVASQLASSSTARHIVLEPIRTSQPVSRVELSRKSGLQPSTISHIFEQLLAEGWIVEGSAAPRGADQRCCRRKTNGLAFVFAIVFRFSLALKTFFALFARIESTTCYSPRIWKACPLRPLIRG
jgi:hypothetical protein